MTEWLSCRYALVEQRTLEWHRCVLHVATVIYEASQSIDLLMVKV